MLCLLLHVNTLWETSTREQWRGLLRLQPGLSTPLLWPRAHLPKKVLPPASSATFIPYLPSPALEHLSTCPALFSLISLGLIVYNTKHTCLCLLKGICPGLVEVENIKGWISPILVSIIQASLYLVRAVLPDFTVIANGASHPVQLGETRETRWRQR